MNSDHIKYLLLKIEEVFPVPPGFSGKISFMLRPDANDICRLCLQLWFELDGEVYPRTILFDNAEPIDDAVLSAIKKAHEANPTGFIKSEYTEIEIERS